MFSKLEQTQITSFETFQQGRGGIIEHKINFNISHLIFSVIVLLVINTTLLIDTLYIKLIGYRDTTNMYFFAETYMHGFINRLNPKADLSSILSHYGTCFLFLIGMQQFIFEDVPVELQHLLSWTNYSFALAFLVSTRVFW